MRVTLGTVLIDTLLQFFINRHEKYLNYEL